MIEKLYTVEEVAELASVTGRTIRNYLKSGRLKGRKIGGQWRFPEGEVQRLLAGVSSEEETASYSAGGEDASYFSFDDDAPVSLPEGESLTAYTENQQPAEPPAYGDTQVLPQPPAPRPEALPSDYNQPATLPPPTMTAGKQVAPTGAPYTSPQAGGVTAPATTQNQVSAQAPAATQVAASTANAPPPQQPQPVQNPAPPVHSQVYAPPAVQEMPVPQPVYGQPVVGYQPAPAGQPQYVAYPVQIPLAMPQQNYYGAAPGTFYTAPAAGAPASQPPNPEPAPMPAPPPVAETAPPETYEDGGGKTGISFADLSDVGKRVAQFAAEIHDCSDGPQTCAVIDMYQSFASAKITSERIADIAEQESENGVFCESFVEFDARHYIARYTLFGSSAFLARCLTLIG